MNPNGYSNVLKVEIAPGFVIEVNLDAYGLHVFDTTEVVELEELDGLVLGFNFYEVRLVFKAEFSADRITGARRSPVRAMLTDQQTVAAMVAKKVREALFDAQKKYAALSAES